MIRVKTTSDVVHAWIRTIRVEAVAEIASHGARPEDHKGIRKIIGRRKIDRDACIAELAETCRRLMAG